MFAGLSLEQLGLRTQQNNVVLLKILLISLSNGGAHLLLELGFLIRVGILVPINADIVQFQLLPEGFVGILRFISIDIFWFIIGVDGIEFQFLKGDSEGVFRVVVLIADVDIPDSYLQIIEDFYD